MYFVILGVLLVLLKAAAFGPVAEWGWLAVLWPFAAAAAWWAWADNVGLTKKREMQKMEQRKQDRRRKSMEALGIDPRARKRADRERAERDRLVAKNQAADRRHKETIARSSRLDSQQSSQFDSRTDPR
jgi:small Trp-rich protein